MFIKFKYSFIYPIIVLFITLFIYILFAGRLTFSFPTKSANYFSHLAYSLLNGRVDLINPSWEHDLTRFNNKLYMYWGPTPTLLILPFVVFFGINISDALYTAIISSFSPFLLFLTLHQLQKANLIKLSNFRKMLIAIFFSFGTVHFSVAVTGSVWFTSQAVTTLFIIFSLYLLTCHLTTSKIVYLIFSSFFLGLAIWGRPTFIFYLPFYLMLIFINKEFVKKSIYFFSILGIIFIFIGLYNFVRFGSVFESGYTYQNHAERFLSDFKKYGAINSFYIPHNFYYMFVNTPKLTSLFPYFSFDLEGNSILVLSPLFVLIFLIVQKKYWRNFKLKLFNLSVISSSLLIITLLLSFMGTGWVQFGYRYALDVIPLFLILIAEVLEDIPVIFVILLIIFSVAINTLGTLWLISI